MQTSLDQFEQRNIAVIAICADPPSKLAEKLLPKGITFSLLSDPELTTIDAYGVRHPGANPFGGDAARPAIFLIDESGDIIETMLTENWRVRPTGEMILSKFTEAR